MIQRIQTLFLLLAGGAIASLFALPFAMTGKPEDAGIFQDAEYNIYDNPVLLALTGLTVIVALVTIFLYRNRIRQLRMGYLGMALSILIPIVAFLYFTSEAGQMDSSQQVDDGLGIFAPLAAIVLFVAANYFVRKDEKLVRSMDRLR